MNDANNKVHYLRDRGIYTPPPDIEPEFISREDVDASDRRNQEMLAGWFIVAAIVLVLVALIWAVWL